MEAKEAGHTKGSGTAPPYVSYRTLKTLVQDLHEHTIPSRIDRDVLKRFSGSVGKQLMTAARFLSLIDSEDRPTDGLRGLVAAHQTPNWSGAVRGMLHTQYKPIFDNIDLATATPSQLHGAFKDAYGGNDAVLKKSEVFFLQAVQDAEIPLSKRITVITRRTPLIKLKRPTAKAEDVKATGDSDSNPDAAAGKAKTGGSGFFRTVRSLSQPSAVDPYQVLVGILDPVNMSGDEQQAVFLLIGYLKRREIEAAMEQSGAGADAA